MRKLPPVLTASALSVLGAAGLAAVVSMQAFAQQGTGSLEISAAAAEQIAAVLSIKEGFTPAQRKIDSTLVLAAKSAAGELAGTPVDGVPSVAAAAIEQTVTVDVHGDASPALLDAIRGVNGTPLDDSAEWGVVRATVPLSGLEALASDPAVKSIQKAARAKTNVGSLTSQGYISHAANQAVNVGVNGTGITVGVLSDSALPARVAALIASGDLPPTTLVLPGQAGPTNGTDEGTAMMEIVHDVAPGANLIFATAFNSVASFASNILALQAAGAQVIVDDVTYFNEGAFQDGPIARAVNQVTAGGALYFSSAANSGSLTLGTSGTWEGDFNPNGAATGVLEGAGELHNFGTAAAPQNYDVLTAAAEFTTLKWSDPLGASANDYDLFVLNAAGTAILDFSINGQTGTQDPYEFVEAPSVFPAGSRIVVVRYAGAPRALRVDTLGARLSIATDGSTFGHNAAASTVTMAATYWNSARNGTRPFVGFANPNETFSSDGPRRMFFNPDGSPITPGNLLLATGGGTVLQKPDLSAADGVSTRTPGFQAFFGTSASAPHAAGIAALIFSARPGWTNAQVREAMKATARDSMAPGVDRDSGFGIAMAWPAIQYALTH
jgi:subtilase family protein